MCCCLIHMMLFIVQFFKLLIENLIGGVKSKFQAVKNNLTFCKPLTWNHNNVLTTMFLTSVVKTANQHFNDIKSFSY